MLCWTVVLAPSPLTTQFGSRARNLICTYDKGKDFLRRNIIDRAFCVHYGSVHISQLESRFGILENQVSAENPKALKHAPGRGAIVA